MSQRLIGLYALGGLIVSLGCMRAVTDVTSYAIAGGFVHIAGSYAAYKGNDKFVTSWEWWYYIHPWRAGIIGTVVALMVEHYGEDAPVTVIAFTLALFSDRAIMMLASLTDRIAGVASRPKTQNNEEEPLKVAPMLMRSAKSPTLVNDADHDQQGSQ